MSLQLQGLVVVSSVDVEIGLGEYANDLPKDFTGSVSVGGMRVFEEVESTQDGQSCIRAEIEQSFNVAYTTSCSRCLGAGAANEDTSSTAKVQSTNR